MSQSAFFQGAFLSACLAAPESRRCYLLVRTPQADDGRYLFPLSIIWPDGREARVEQIHAVCPALANKGALMIIRFDCTADGAPLEVYLEKHPNEPMRWFILLPDGAN